MKKATLALLVVVSVFMASLAWGSTPFNQSKPATKDQVFDNLDSVYLGRFFVQRGADETPFLPKGFPQWGQSHSDVIAALGSPEKSLQTWDMTLDIYGNEPWSVGIGYIGGKMSLVCFGEFRAQMDYYGKVSGWSKENAPTKASAFDRDKNDERPLYKVYFYNSSKSMKYKIYSWGSENEEIRYLPDVLRFIGTKEAAQAFGVM